MHGYVDPFAHRLRRATPDDSSDASPNAETPAPQDEAEEPDGAEHDGAETDAIGLNAIVDDAKSGRREAPFAENPANRVRGRSE